MNPESCCGERDMNLERSLMLYLFNRIVVGLVKCPATGGTSVSSPPHKGKEHHRKAGRKLVRARGRG